MAIHGREYGSQEKQSLHFVFLPGLRFNRPGNYMSYQSISDRWHVSVEKSGIRRHTPYQTRHTFACWVLVAGANPSFIASQLGHEDAEMVYRVYSAWINDYDGEQIDLLNSKMGITPTMPPTAQNFKLIFLYIIKLKVTALTIGGDGNGFCRSV